jgi:hypothetical protein
MVLHLSFSTTGGGNVVVTSEEPVVTTTNVNLDYNCHLDKVESWIAEYYSVDVQQKIREGVAQEAASLASQLATQWSEPLPSTPYDNVTLEYQVREHCTTLQALRPSTLSAKQYYVPAFVSQVASITATAGQSLQTSFRLRVNATSQLTGQNVTYVPDDPVAAALFPPVFPPHPTPPISTPGVVLTEVRLSSTVFDGVLFATDIAGHGNFSAETAMLDANLSTRVTYARPTVVVPADSVMRITVANGSVTTMCLNKGCAMADFRFTGLQVRGAQWQ